jgi:hypothetical protein
MRQNKPVSCPGVTSDVAFGVRSPILECQGCLRRRWLPTRIAEMARIAAISARSRDEAAAANPARHADFALDFEREESVCVAMDGEPDWLAPLPRQRPVGLRGA